MEVALTKRRNVSVDFFVADSLNYLLYLKLYFTRKKEE